MANGQHSVTANSDPLAPIENQNEDAEVQVGLDDLHRANDDESQGSSSARPRYSLLRNYSLIVPTTGERVRRRITLNPFDSISDISGRERVAADDEFNEADEDDALLGTEGSNGAISRPKRRSLRRWLSRHFNAMSKWVFTLVQSVVWLKWIYDHVFFQEFSRPLKCALTYFLASFTVFSSTLSGLLGPGDGKHLTATVTVYFHPARSIGSMIEATAFAEGALLYSTFLSVCSMEVSALFKRLDMLAVGHTIVLVVFCAGGLGSISLMKQKMGKQTFNTACSVASTQFTRTLVREGSVQNGTISYSRILQGSVIVNLGILISAMVCLLVFPYTAIGKLKKSCNLLMDTYSLILASVTKSFLSGTDVSKGEIEALFKSTQKLFSSVDSCLQEAKYEHYVCGTEEEYFLQARLVKSIQSLAQHLGGLRSSLNMEWTLTNLESGHARSSCKELFDIFVYYLGPPMKSLTFTVKCILEALPFDDHTIDDVSLNPQFASSLTKAIDLFSGARTKALREIYSQEVFKASDEEARKSLAIHLEKVASTCGQFSHGLENLAREIHDIIKILQEYKEYVDNGRSRSWWWLRFWKPNPKNRQKIVIEDEDADPVVPSNLAHLFSDDGDAPTTKEAIREAPVTLKIWRSLHLFRRTDVRFGIKVGVGALLFALPAYIPQTRSIFSHYRGEWGLVTFVLMMNFTIGGTTTTIFWRILGTIIGCYSACLAWLAFGANKTALSLTGLFIAIPCFSIILGWKSDSSFGRFILLAFNLTALYSYSLSRDDIDHEDQNEDEGGLNPIVGEIAFHRLVSVTAGVLWSLFIALYIWPNSARRNFKRKLSVLWIRMGLIWKRDPLDSLTATGQPLKPYVSIQDEQTVQKSLFKLRTLMSAASSEFRLKGPFQSKEYDTIMTLTQEILDVYHNMNAMITKDLYASERESQIIAYTIEERKELSSRIFLLFYLIASALRLGLPLPDHLPNTAHARDRMIVKVNEYRMKHFSEDSSRDDDFVLFYAFILATMSINDGLLAIIERLQEIYGSIEAESLSL
ncbi:Fusaric acid resistance protein-like-domain-containing protein [Lipomyces arxii]|uniref:Fusaric acid resistance protein-like-domain-containing protein n=1 Tax=Lipomyces arxii TaxID=56418 RepID=UPI0034CDE61B